MQIKRELQEKERNPRPTLGQLKAWCSDEITTWIMKQLYHRFPDYRHSLPLKTHENALDINYKVGYRHVLEAIEKLVETGEI